MERELKAGEEAAGAPRTMVPAWTATYSQVSCILWMQGNNKERAAGACVGYRAFFFCGEFKTIVKLTKGASISTMPGEL